MLAMSLNQLASVLRRYSIIRATLVANLLVKKTGRLSLEEGNKIKIKNKYTLINTLMNKKHSYDIIIIGSGIAGLYSAYNIQRLAPNKSFLVLEKYKKNWIGGRINNEEFYGTTVVTGAGIGRKDKDHLLQALLKELHIEYTDFKLDVNYALVDGEPVDVNKIFHVYLEHIF